MAAGTSRRLLEPEPPRGVRLDAAPGIFRVVAGNPGPMTYHGTNTWFVEQPEGGLAVIDPGPDDPHHLDAILAAGEGRISHILLSHAHADHAGLAPRLADALSLPIQAHRLLACFAGFMPDVALSDGDQVAGLEVLHTPGHAQDHLCFARPDGVLFTADHVMGWSTSVVPPAPHGSAHDYVSSLKRVRDRGDQMLLSGHGPAIDQPRVLITKLLAQRRRREQQVIDLLASEARHIDAFVALLYPSLKPGLDRAARANIAGFLEALAADGLAAADGEIWRWVGPLTDRHKA